MASKKLKPAPEKELKKKKSLIERPDPKDQPEEIVVSQTDGDDVRTQEAQEKVIQSPLVARIVANLEEAETSRYTPEQQWTANLKAYRGEDSNIVGENGDAGPFRKSEEKKPYVRTTTVKTRAAYAQIMESLMQNSRFPLMIEATPDPEGVPEFATNDPQAQTNKEPETQEDFNLGFEGDGRTMEPGATFDNMSWKEDDPLYANMQEGTDKSGGQFAQLSPAQKAAEKMNKIIMDQLEESNAHTELRKSVFEACLLGTGIMKGVFTEEKTIHKWVDGNYSPETRKFPKMHHVSVWDIYVDPNAVVLDDAEWIIERHRMTSKQLRDLKGRPFFKPKAIDKCIADGANYTNKSFEHIVRDREKFEDKARLWEVLEYWGYMSVEEAISVGLPVEGAVADQIQVNMWLCGDEVLRVVANPFLPQRLPYFLFNYEVDPYNIYGTGVPETMQDSQKMMNGFARLAVDNLALAGNMVFDVDDSMLVAGQDLDIYPGKVFRRQGGQAGQAVHGIKFPSTANENIQMFREWRQIADESTGIPSVSHGQTGVTGVGRTSSGLNMILENASLNIKTVIRNIDDDCLQPMGKMLFYWNHQFNSENVPQGDFDCVATGIRSYTKQEIKVQRLQTLLGLVQNPAIAPMVKLPYIVRELVKGMDLDPEAAINDMDEAKLYAEIIGLAGGVGAQAKQAAQAQAEGPTGTTGNTSNNEGAGNQEGVNGTETELTL